MTERAGMRLLRTEPIPVPAFFEIENLHFSDHEGREVVRSVVRHPGAVVVVPVRDGNVTLIRQYRPAVDAEVLELPAGKLDVTGEQPQAAAIRECEEEIGLRPEHVTHLVTFFNSPGFTDEQTHIFLATEFTDVGRSPVGQEEVAAEIIEADVGEAIDMIRRGEINDAKSIIGLLTYLHLHGRS